MSEIAFFEDFKFKTFQGWMTRNFCLQGGAWER